MQNENYEDVSLELGAVIKIISETNSTYHNKYFLIDYLDNDKIVIVDQRKILRKLSIKDGVIEDNSITQIILVDRPEHPGFAKQNGMEIGTFWSIHFGFDGGEIVKGKIVGLENDQIELLSPQYPDAPLVIDFQYKGIPQNLNIISIKKWNKEESDEEKDEEEEEEEQKYDDDEFEGIIDILDEDLIPDQIFDSKEIEDSLKEDIISADKIKIIETDVTVTQVKTRSERDRVFDIDYQVDDLMDNLLAKININNRNESNNNKIHLTIERYLQLRKKHSVFDEDNYVTEPIIKTKNHKPLIECLSKFNKNHEWIIPIVRHRKQLSDIQNISDVEDDVIMRTTEENITELMDAQDNMYNDIVPDGVNKYLYIYGKKYSNIESSFNKDNTIIEQNVNADFFTVVDNLNNYNSSAIQQISNFETCIDDSKILKDDAIINVTDIKFQTQTYNSSYMTPFYDKREGKNAFFKELVSPDKISLMGFIVLPHLIEYSKLYLKNTNLYKRAILNNDKHDYFKLFRLMRNNNRFMGKKLLYDNDNKKSFHKQFLKKITEYRFKDNEEWNDKSTEDNIDNYNNFLESIFPNTREIIKKVYTDLSNNFIRITDYGQLVDQLEPYKIYEDDIELYHYIQIQKSLEHSRKEYYKDIGFTYNSLNQYYMDFKSYNLPSIFFDYFKDKDAFNGIDCKCYNFDETETDTQYLKKVINIDNGRAFNNCVSLYDINNINYESIPDKIEALKADIQNIKDTMEDGGDCSLKPKILTKKFNNFESLRKEDKLDVYFDKVYDDTPYDIIDEMPHLKYMEDKIQKKRLLKDHLMNIVGLEEERAERDSDSMINKKKKIIDGEYALVDIGEYQYRYYIRKNQKWVLDDTLNDLSPEELNFVNCNMKRKCMSINNKCLNIKDQTGKLQEELIAETIENIETDMLEKINVIKSNLEKNIKYNIDNLTLLRKLNTYKKLNYDIKRVKLSNDIDLEEYDQSPYIEIRDKVLTEYDEYKKYDNIIKFVDEFCRSYSKIKNEDPNWFYCKKSDDDGVNKSNKLLPTFFYELANAYMNDTYQETMQKIIDERGTKSEESNDKYVDKYSGFVISTVLYEEEQKYEKSGQKIIMREIIDTTDEDAVEAQKNILLREETPQQKMSKDEKMIKDVLTTYDNIFGFNTKNKHEWMHQYVKRLIKESRQRKTEFDKRTEEMKKEKKDPKYSRNWTKYHHKFIFKSVLAVYAVVIQTSIPHIKQGNSITPCQVDLDGFPMGKDLGFLEYLTCATLKLRVNNKEEPWNCLKKIKKKKDVKPETTKFAKEIKDWIVKYFIKNVEIKAMIETKKTYMKQKDKKVTTKKIVNTWENFLPPLIRTQVRKIEKMGDGYDNKILKSYSNVSNESVERLNKLKSKIDLYSHAIIESLQNVIDKQPLILKTEDDVPYTENNCCNDDNVLNTYEYFVTLDDTIQKYNELVIEYKKVLYKHKRIVTPPLLISEIDTRKEKSIHSTIFSESTIYLSFIKYCYFNTGIPLNESLKQLCNKNISEIKKIDTIQDKIDILKSEGHNWNDEALKQLLLYVSRRNVEEQNMKEEDSSIIFDKASILSSRRQIFENWVSSMRMNKTTFFGLDELLPIMERLYDTYDVAKSEKEKSKRDIDFTDEVIEGINFINKKLSKKIVSKLKTIEKTKHAMNFIQNLQEFNLRGEDLFMSKDDETQISLSNLIITMIKDMVIVYPYIIKNGTDRFTEKKLMKTMPEHWGFGSKKFSFSHKNNIIKSMVSLNKLEKFSCDEKCKVVMGAIEKIKKDILDFIDLMPFLSNIGDNKTIFNGKVYNAVITNVFYSTILLHYEIVKDIISNKYDKDDPNQESELYGELEDYELMVTNIINTYLNIFKDTKKMLDKDPETIKNDVLKEKEIEKENIKDQFNRLDEENRKIERELKKHKLGEWSIGLSKAIFQYDPDMYDRELQQQQRINEMLNQNGVNLSPGEQNTEGNMFSGLSDATTNLLIEQQGEHEIHNEMYGMMDDMGDEEDMDGRDDLY